MEKYFTQDHEWLLVDNNTATIGITHHAQSELGDIVFVELPEVGAELIKGQEVAVIESVKAAGEINAPLDGTVIEINEKLAENPELVNEDAQGDGWFFKLKLAAGIDDSQFMAEQEYIDLVSE